MFHLILTLAYIIPNIYVFFRIKNLFITKRYRIWYTLVYIGLVLFYPLAEGFSHRDLSLTGQIVSTISGYILPFYLYIFLQILLFDLFLLLNLMVRMVPRDAMKGFHFRFYSLTTIILISAGVVVAGAINLNTIRISRYRVEVPKRNSKIDHLRIAFTADFHIQTNTSIKFIEQYVMKVNALQPDLVLYGGDMTEGDRDNETDERIESPLQKVQSRYGIFCVLGNHEFYGGQERSSFFRNAGITVLCDTILKIDSAFYLAGRYDEHFRRRKNVSEILAAVPDDLPVILLDHRPSQIEEVSKSKVDVQFSGHTHNGQLFPINFITRQFFVLTWGYKKIANTHFFVTSGLRLWGPPVKTAGKSEIILVDINFRL